MDARVDVPGVAAEVHVATEEPHRLEEVAVMVLGGRLFGGRVHLVRGG
jgi:hypothetical protein